MIARRQADLALAEADRWPVIQYGVGPGYGGSYGGGGNQSALRASLGIDQLLWDFGASRGRIAAATDMEAAARFNRADTAEKVAQAALSAYADAAAAGERQDAARQAIAAMRQVRERIGQRVRAGLANRSDLNTADAALRRAELDAQEAGVSADAAMSRLIELIGIAASRLTPLRDNYEMIAVDAQAEPDLEAAPAIQAAVRAVDAAAARQESASAELLPSINIGISRSVSTGNYSANDSTWIGLLLKGSFSVGGAGWQRVAAARADGEAARQDLEARRLQARIDWQVARRDQEGARQRLDSLGEVAALWRTTRDLYWDEYILDKRSLGDVIYAEREIHAARAEQIQALAGALAAALKARVAQGGLIELLENTPTGNSGERKPMEEKMAFSENSAAADASPWQPRLRLSTFLQPQPLRAVWKTGQRQASAAAQGLRLTAAREIRLP